MLEGLNIAKETKHKLKTTLKKYPTLFGGGSDTLDMKHVEIELKEDAKLYTGRFYNILKAYKNMAKIEVHCLCTVDILQKFSHTEDISGRRHPSVR